MFELTFGDVGSCKSLDQAKTCLRLLQQSKKIEKKYKLPKREIWINTPMNQKVLEKYEDRLKYWQDPMEMIFTDYPTNKIKRRNIDVVWDEIAVELPSDRWKDLDAEIRKFFAQHRHRGIRIFANTQDYMMVDINARRMATKVFEIKKKIGSKDPSPTLPPVKYIWGLALKWELNKQLIRKDDQVRKKQSIIPEFVWITRKYVELYDMTYDIDKKVEYLVHRKRTCPVCGLEKITHT
jgi:hypothetical protein